MVMLGHNALQERQIFTMTGDMIMMIIIMKFVSEMPELWMILAHALVSS